MSFLQICHLLCLYGFCILLPLFRSLLIQILFRFHPMMQYVQLYSKSPSYIVWVSSKLVKFYPSDHLWRTALTSFHCGCSEINRIKMYQKCIKNILFLVSLGSTSADGSGERTVMILPGRQRILVVFQYKLIA